MPKGLHPCALTANECDQTCGGRDQQLGAWALCSERKRRREPSHGSGFALRAFLPDYGSAVGTSKTLVGPSVPLAQMTRKRLTDHYLNHFGYFDPGAGRSEFITRMNGAPHQIGEFISQIARRSRFWKIDRSRF